MSDSFRWDASISADVLDNTLNIASRATWENIGALPIHHILTPQYYLDSAKACWSPVRSFKGKDGQAVQNAIVSHPHPMGEAFVLTNCCFEAD
jgi:hypothetical protein